MVCGFVDGEAEGAYVGTMTPCDRELAWCTSGLGLVLWMLSGCGGGQAETPEPQAAPAAEASSGDEPAAPAEEQPPDLEQHMRTSFWNAVDARDALIAGDLAEAKRMADRLAKEDFGNRFPDDWKHWVKEMQRHAGDIAIAGSMAEAAKSLALLGQACGNCHWQADRGPEQPRDPPLPWEEPPEDVGARMFRHDVGADQMWMGLIDPSEEAWRSGTVTITRAPLVAPVQEGSEVDEQSHAQVEVVRELAKQARAARTHEKRAEIYAQLITTCAECHAVTLKK